MRVRVIGRRDGLGARLLVTIIDDAQARTAKNDRFHLNIAFNYGGQADLAAGRPQVRRGGGGRPRQALGPRRRRPSPPIWPPRATPAPDVIIRPRGEQRLSNFLLWEAAYAELIFQDVLWPDYGADHLKAALAEFAGAGAALRRRRGR